jgi:LEA14-like dessication related protein
MRHPDRAAAPHRRGTNAPARRRVVAGLVAGLGAAASTACGALLPPANLKPPSVSFSDLSIDSVNAERVRFTVTIATQNPNAIDLPLSNVYFDLAILGQRLAEGKVADQRFTLPANGARDLPLSFSVATADMRAVVARMFTGPLPDTVWQLKGTLNWGASPLPLPFEKSGDAQSLRRLRELLRF